MRKEKIMRDYITPQEEFWAGEFGDEYTDRNNGTSVLAKKIMMFSQILKRTIGIKSCLEFGSNRGLNLMALGEILPELNMQAVEINKKAAQECSKIKNVKVFNGSAFDFKVEKESYDLAFTCGVLIHISPDRLRDMYHMLYEASKKYILIIEYYNPVPVEVKYRNNEGKLFKRGAKF